MLEPLMSETDRTPEEIAAEERRFRQKNRSIICRRCGALGTHERDGKDMADGFPGIKYKVCGSCGHAEAKTARQKRDRL
jgi:ribosomal protein L37E